MIDTFFGFKLACQQTFSKKGKKLAVTKLLTQPCTVNRIKTKERDGYQAIVVKLKIKNEKLKIKRKELMREIKVNQLDKFKVGDNLKVDQAFKAGDKVMVTGRTKGKGFAGVVKRWGFAGGPKTHGQSDRERAPGSIGQRTDPGRVWKGKKMAGRLGGKTKTIKGLKVFKIDGEKNQIWLQGLVPGGRWELVKIRKLT